MAGFGGDWGGGWHSRQAQQAFSWGTGVRCGSPLVSGDALTVNFLGREKGASAAVVFFFFLIFSFERKEALS